MTYVLHYAPDNASLIIRLALEHRGLQYRSQLVDRKTQAQRSDAYLRMNPNGLIPVLETPQGPLFETGAILLWLADRHGRLGPGPEAQERADFLKWLFFLSNTPHPLLRQMFYTQSYVAADHVHALRDGLVRRLKQHFQTLENVAQTNPSWLGAETPTVLDFYLCALLRWARLYPADAPPDWLDLAHYPGLQNVCARVETLPACAALHSAEGLGKTPFTNPELPNPPEGSAT